MGSLSKTIKVPIHNKMMFEEAGIDVPDAVVGRAHDGIDKTVEASLFTSYIELKCMVQIKI